MRPKQKKTRWFTKKKIFVPLILLVVAIGVFSALEASNKTHFFGDNHASEDKPKAQTTSDAPTAQEDFTGGDDRQPNTQTNTGGEGTVSSTNGNISSIPPQSEWTTSPSGAITVYSPAKNSLLTNGNTISGKATAAKVSFRLIDDVTGVIAQGELPVVNGNFSGKFNFSTTATSGRLDVFNTREDGVEINNVEIPIRFK